MEPNPQSGGTPPPYRTLGSHRARPIARRDLNESSDRLGWQILIGFAVIVAGMLLVRAGSLLEIGYLPVCFLLAVYFHHRYPKVYIAQCILVVCTAAFIRRAAEGSEIREGSQILGSGVAVCLVAVFGLLRFNFLDGKNIVYTLALMAIGYGAAIGMLTNGIVIVLLQFAIWLVPIVFGIYCFQQQRLHPETARSYLRISLYTGFVVSLYGLVQYVSPPIWDVRWLTAMQARGLAGSMGSPEPFGLRIFSTFSNAQGAAAILGLCLLQASQLKSRWRLPVMLVSLTALAVTFVRSSWVACALAGLVLLFRANAKARVQAAVIAVALVGCLAAAAATPVGDAIVTRLATLQSVKSDGSYQIRKEGRDEALKLAEATFPFGAGIGFANNPGINVKFATMDVGLTTVPIELGLLGTLAYGAAILTVLIGPVQKGFFRGRTELALAISVLFMTILLAGANSLNTTLGIFFWGPVGMLMAGQSSPSGTPKGRLVREKRGSGSVTRPNDREALAQ